jgi:GNAT superfamily N-acetyltransferase
MKVLALDAKELSIRRVRQNDAERIAALSGQLGYPATSEEIRGRLKSASAEKHTACFVAETKERGVIGWVQVSATSLLDADLSAEINGLVVDEAVRSRGAGALLMETAEKWAQKMRCKRMSVRSKVIRERAHEFYSRLGYEHYKTQKAFQKKL